VDSAGALPATVAAAKPGRAVELEVWRDRASHKLSVKLGETETATVAANTTGASGGRLGLRVRPASADETGNPESARGLVVEAATGPAAAAGIQPGDIVLSANGRPVRDVEDLRAAVTDSKELVALLVQRGSSRIFVPVELA